MLKSNINKIDKEKRFRPNSPFQFDIENSTPIIKKPIILNNRQRFARNKALSRLYINTEPNKKQPSEINTFEKIKKTGLEFLNKNSSNKPYSQLKCLNRVNSGQRNLAAQLYQKIALINN